MTNVEADIKANLVHLSKMPAKEFETHFRNWMERDDVARALQAKLRADLISNFNKTVLGRQILAQTSVCIQRLTLSPLVLALNTLVAEFLYSQNCHFTLSVFCTEVPYSNTLPDFDNSQNFRFTKEDIKDILEAIFGGKSSYEEGLKISLTKNYKSNKNASLLLLLIRHLLNQKDLYVKQIASMKSGVVNEGTQTVHSTGDTDDTEDIRPIKKSSRKTQHSQKEIPQGNLKYFNKYLMMLSAKVKEMSEQFEELQQKYSTMPSTRISKSVRIRRYDKLNRSLERIMEQLKHMTHTKRKSKQVGAVVSAIDALSNQFSKCVESFKTVTKDLISANQKQNQHIQDKPLNAQAAAQVDLSYRHVTAGEQKRGSEEKSYVDWVHEMRHTKNGQKFLERIEVSLKKALNKQRELLKTESEEKFRHQKELLKIQYKEKLIEHITRLPTHLLSQEANKFNESVAQQLEEFQLRHSELLQKIQEVGAKHSHLVNTGEENLANANGRTGVTETAVVRIAKERESKKMSVSEKDPLLCETSTRDPIIKNVLKTQKELQKMVQSVAKQERNVDEIVHEARMRIKELEYESNQLELNFRNYLERQRVQAETMREVVSSLSENSKNVQSNAFTYSKVLKNIPPHSTYRSEKEYREQKTKKRSKMLSPKKSITIDLTNQENKNPNIKYPNAMLDAKENLLKNYHKKTATKEVNDAVGDEFGLTGVEHFHYKQNFGRIESRVNIHSIEQGSYHINGGPASHLLHTSQLPFTCDTSHVNTLISTSMQGQPKFKSVQKLPIFRNVEAAGMSFSKISPPLLVAMPSTASVQDVTETLKVGSNAVNDGKRRSERAEQAADILVKPTDSETSSTSNDSDLKRSANKIDASKNGISSSSAESDKLLENNALDAKQTQPIRKIVSTGSDEDIRANSDCSNETKTKEEANPTENSKTLMKTMERMQRLFTETQQNVRPAVQVKTQQKQKFKDKQKQQHSRSDSLRTPQNSPSKSSAKIIPCKSLVNLENGKVKSSLSSENSKTESERQKQPLQSIQKRDITKTASSPTTATSYHSQYNITINEKLPKANASTTFAVHYDDNLKEVVSDPSLESANMFEAVDEEIELDKLTTDAEHDDGNDDADEHEEEKPEEEKQQMAVAKNAVAITLVKMPLIEAVSADSSTNSSVLQMSAHGGGGGGAVADRPRHSDSGSDFWE